ncbi:MAG: hypothetical protein WDO06_06410 [Actinomycetota bacterium]
MAKALATTLETEFTFDEIIGVLGAFGDKDVVGILKALEPVINSLIVTSSTSSRAMPVDELESAAVSIFGRDRVARVDELEDAIKVAIKDANRPLSDESVGVVVTGSVVTVGEARTILRRLSA